jgi:hypothetical protein
MTIRAIYNKGVLKPLALAENQTVELEVTILASPTLPMTSLFGVFPQLAALAPADLLWAKQQLSRTIEKQSNLLDALH